MSDAANVIAEQPARARRIIAAVASWPDVEVGPHRFGGVEFRVGRREVGHLHADRIADLPFPRRVRDELIAAGRVLPHHVLPDSGWVTFRIQEPGDVEAAVELFRLSYERAVHARATPSGPTGGAPAATTRDLVQDVEIPLRNRLVNQATDQRLVFLDRHVGLSWASAALRPADLATQHH